VIRRVCDDEPRPVREVNSEIPDWLAAIIDRLLAKEPESRFESASEVARLLNDHLAHLQRPADAPKPAPLTAASHKIRSSGKRRRRLVQLSLAAGVVLLFAGFCLTELTGLTHIFTGPPRAPAALPAIGKSNQQATGTLQVNIQQLKGNDDNVKVVVHRGGYEQLFREAGIHDRELPIGKYRLEVRDKDTNELIRQGPIDIVPGAIRRVQVWIGSYFRAPLLTWRSPAAELSCGSASPFVLAFSRDGTKLATSAGDGVISLWSGRGTEWKRITSLKGPDGSVA
jgi:hypothetical protein